MKKVLKEIKIIDNKIIRIMKSGFKFSFVLCLFFTYILYLYTLNPISHTIFEIGFLGVRCSFMFFVSFFLGAITSNKIVQDIR